MQRNVLATLLSAVMVVSLVGCGSGQTAATQSRVSTAAAESESKSKNKDGTYSVAFICKSYSDTFCLTVKDEFEKAAADYTDVFTVDYFDSENTAATQIDQIETCTAANYDAIVFQQVDSEAPVEVVKQAVDKGVKVIVTTGHIEDGGASWYVDADPYQQGQVVAEYAVDNGFCDDAEIAILSGPVGNFHSENRIQAFRDVVEAKEGTKLVASEVADWSKDTAMTIAQNWLVAYPDLKVILAANDDMAMGEVEAIEMEGKENDIKVFAIDGTEAGIEAVADGRLQATVQQDVRGYAVEALNILNNLLEGEDAESLNIDSTLITKENCGDFQ